MSYAVLAHAAPYSSPNENRRLPQNWVPSNIKVFQENPNNANSLIFVSFDLTNASNPKAKTYHMQYSIGDGNDNDNGRFIDRNFATAYDRQRASSYGFAQLNESEKKQILIRLHAAYNKWSGMSHSDEPEDDDVVDCTEESGDVLEHKAKSNLVRLHHAWYDPSHDYNSPVNNIFNEDYNIYQKPDSGWFEASFYYPEGAGYNGYNAASVKFSVFNGIIRDIDNGVTKPLTIQNLKQMILHAVTVKLSSNQLVKGMVIDDATAARAAAQAWSDMQDDIAKINNRKRREANTSGKFEKNDSGKKPGSWIRKQFLIQHSAYTVVPAGEDELYHHGVLGMKWGVRRYQNTDGSLTDLGKKHYGLGDPKYQRKKGIAESETVMKRINSVRNGANVYIDKEKFRNSSGNEDKFKTGEAHAEATANYAEFLSNSYKMFDSMIPKRMTGETREKYISYLLNQTVADLNANPAGFAEKGVKIKYGIDTSRGLNDIDFRVDFEYPDEKKIK